MKIKILTSLVLLLIASAVPAAAEVLPFNIELGYRWLDLSGSEPMYRTQLNERQGFVLRSFALSSNENGGAFDHFRLDATELGVGPYGALRIEAGKTDLYRLRVGYRTVDDYSSLPYFTSLLTTEGTFPGLHSYDRTRTMFDVDVEFMPGRKFTPFVGWSQDRFNGPGASTYTIGGDEFRLQHEMKDRDEELRAGVAFNLGKYYGSVTQGWRNLESNETFVLMPGAGAGEGSGTILGSPISATGITRNTATDITTPFTNAYVTADVTGRVRLIGEFVSYSSETQGTEVEEIAGSFVSFANRAFFSRLQEEVASDAENKTWRGGVRAEIGIVDGVDFLAGYRKSNQELSGGALINSLFASSVSFGGATLGDVAHAMSTENSVDRDQEVMEAALVARALGPFALRVGYSTTDQSLTVTPDLEEIVVPGGQGGTFERSINTYDVTGSFRSGGINASATYRTDRADEAVFRTDYLDRDRFRVRAGWTGFGDRVRIGATAEQTEQTNDLPTIDFTSEIKQYTADLEVAPIQVLRLRASVSQFDGESSILFVRPETLTTQRSDYLEEGSSVEGGIGLVFAKFTFDGGFGRFENEGSSNFELDRLRARVGFDIRPNFGIGAEYSKDEYSDSNFIDSDYDATRIGVFIRLHR
ncbi:MAG: hypothetical protein WA208_01955 [Thermoanaerobaculia bacterium]